MTISVFSQSTYPKKILWENDTILAITKPQLVKINRSLNDYIHLKKLNKNLQMDLCVTDSLCAYWETIATERESIIRLERTKFEDSRRITESLQKSLEEQKTKNRKTIIKVGVGGILTGILLGLFIK